jgi:hypothetical protein
MVSMFFIIEETSILTLDFSGIAAAQDAVPDLRVDVGRLAKALDIGAAAGIRHGLSAACQLNSRHGISTQTSRSPGLRTTMLTCMVTDVIWSVILV